MAHLAPRGCDGHHKKAGNLSFVRDQREARVAAHISAVRAFIRDQTGVAAYWCYVT